MLLVFGHFFATPGKSLLFLIIDPVLIAAWFSASAHQLVEGRCKRHNWVRLQNH